MSYNEADSTESYLVRLWRDGGNSPWRATVHKVRTRQVCHFACPEDLWTYLQAEMAEYVSYPTRFSNLPGRNDDQRN